MRKFAILLFLLVFFCNADAQSRISITWEVVNYDITATLPRDYANDRDLDVAASLTIKNVSTRPFSRVTLRISDQATISSITANASATDFRKSEESLGGSRKLQRAIVRLPSIAPNSTVKLRVNYKLRVESNSGLNALSPVGSQFLPMSFWYPTPNSWFFNGGADFAPFKLRVVNNSSSSLVSSGAINDGQIDQKLNSQPFFATGNWTKLESSGVTVFAPTGAIAEATARAKELAELLSEANEFVESLSGMKSGVPARIVSVDRGGGYSDGGTVFLDDAVFNRGKIDSQTAMILVESAAKVWLGNIVEVQGDGYGVIREGLAKFIATQFIEKKYGKVLAETERLRQRTNYAAIASRDAPLNIVSPIDGYYFTSTSNKGAMIWNFLAREAGQGFYGAVRGQANDRKLELSELRTAFSAHKDYLDYMLEKATNMNLMVGLPRSSGGQTTVAVRNISEIVATVNVDGTTSTGQKVTSRVTVPANGFGQAVFQGGAKIVRVEVDAEKIYPQSNYLDDVAPREISENDPILYVKRDFDRRRYQQAEAKARSVINHYPNFDEAKILLGRSLLAQGKNAEADGVFNAVLGGQLPSAQSLAWANVGLGQTAAKSGRRSKAIGFFNNAIKADAEYGATLTARRGRAELSGNSAVDSEILDLFKGFDAAVKSNTKARISTFIVPGEVSRFASGLIGQVQNWNTTVSRVDQIDSENILVETSLSVRLLGRNDESGLAVFRLSKVAGRWKLSGVEIFEVG